MALFPSEAWLDLYVERINQSKEYQEAAATWEGDVAYVFEAEPDKNVPDELWAWLDLWHGECRGARMITAAEGDASAYGIRAPYSRWREVVLGDLEPVKAMVQGKLKLRGDLANIVRHVRAAKELVHLTTLVSTEFLGTA